jgi:HAE1 family hydrophobic/amphiphilic exporter-1
LVRRSARFLALRGHRDRGPARVAAGVADRGAGAGLGGAAQPSESPAAPDDASGDDADGSDTARLLPARTLLQRSYLPVLQVTLRRPVVSLVVAVGILLGTVTLAPQLRANFSATRAATRCQ